MQNQGDPTSERSRPLTSDSSREDRPSDFEEFFDRIHRVARLQLPASRRYTDVFSLLLRWEDDDLGTEKEATELEELLQNTYHHNTERYLIPSNHPEIHLEYKLNDFRTAHDNESNLLIIYYGGHGLLERRIDRPSRSVWMAHRKSGATLVWSDLQSVLESAQSDVVFILDCCFAASASRSGGSKEGLWACNSEATTTDVNDNSFTQNLIEELKSLSTSRFNVAILHRNLMRRYRKQGSPMLRTEPWYTYLGDDPAISADLTPQPPRVMASAGTTLPTDQPRDETFVVFAAHLRNPTVIPNLSQSSWQNWLHNWAPNDVDLVRALGIVQIGDPDRLEADLIRHSGATLGDSGSNGSVTSTANSPINTSLGKSVNTATESGQTSTDQTQESGSETHKPKVVEPPGSNSPPPSVRLGIPKAAVDPKLKRRNTFPLQATSSRDDVWDIRLPKRHSIPAR